MVLKSLRNAYFHFPHTLKAKCSLTETSNGQMKALSALRGTLKKAPKSFRTAYFHLPRILQAKCGLNKTSSAQMKALSALGKS